MDFVPSSKPAQPAPDDTVDIGKKFESLHDFKAGMHSRTRFSREPVFKGGNAAAHEAMSDALRQVVADAEADPDPGESEAAASASEEKSGLAYEDPWDKPGAINDANPGDDGFASFRVGKGVPLELPASVMAVGEADEAAFNDFSFVAAREGWSKELAQSLVNLAVDGVRSERSGPDGYDQDRTVSELRFEWGEQLEPTLTKIAEYCARRPALSAWLDTTGAGDSPTALRILGALATDETLLTKTGAQKFVDSLGSNEKYWQGDKLELAKAKLAFTVLG